MWRALALLVVTACGDGLDSPDAAIAPESELGLVTVQYYGGVPGGNVVFFQNADSSLVLATRTDAGGRANAYMRPGGFATIVGHNGNSYLMYTWAGVQPGDELTLDRRAFLIGGAARPFLISVPPEPQATGYELRTECGVFGLNWQSPSTLIDLHLCDATTDMLVLVSRSGVVTKYLYVEDVPLATTGLSLGGEYRPLDEGSVAVTGGPTDSVSGTATQFLVGHGRELYRTTQRGFALTDGAGSFTEAMPLPPTATRITSIAFAPAPAAIGAHHGVTWAPPMASRALELAGRVHSYSSDPQYAPATSSVRWTETPDGMLADAVMMQFGWFRPSAVENYQWQVIAPRTPEAIIELPQLPREALRPRADDTLIEPTLLVNIKIDGGYDRIRTRLLGRWTPDEPWPTDGAAGTVIFEDLAPR